MNRGKNFTQASNLNKLALLKDFSLAIFSCLVVLVATLYPFNFALPDNLSLPGIVASFDNISSVKDQVNNILLFMPVGFGLSALLQRVRINPIIKFLTIILISAGLSTLVEFLQVFLPSRAPTPADIINNSAGGMLGIICFYIWNSQRFTYILSSLENSRTSNSNKKLTLFFIGYIFLSFLVSISWQGTTHFSNWGLNYPLLLGNELTGDRPWNGYISEVNIADKAISKTEASQIFEGQNYLDNIGNSLIASYKLSGKESYPDRTGKLPELLPQGQLSDIQEGEGATLSSSHWLETESPPKFLNKRLRETSQFTIITTVATADIAQTGPARIISLSGDTLRRNLTLGQEGSNLDVRLRTPMTGDNGTDLRLNFPDIFTDTKPHQIVVTYSKANLQVYVDKLQNSYSLNLLELVPKEQKMFFYGLTFIPLGICLSLLSTLARRRLSFYWLLLLGGILLPSLIVEAILVTDTGKNISLQNLVISILFTAGTTLILKLRAAALVKRAA
jgi:glycopeptide antibiotics resistance protein